MTTILGEDYHRLAGKRTPSRPGWAQLMKTSGRVARTEAALTQWRRCLLLTAVAVVTAGCAQDSEDGSAGLLASSRNTCALESYSFKVTETRGVKGGEFSHSCSGKYVKDVGTWLRGSFNKTEFELYQRGRKYAAKKGTTWVENDQGHMAFSGLWAQIRDDLEISADEVSNTLKRSDEKTIGGKVCRLYEANLQPKAAQQYFAGMDFMGVQSGRGSGSARIWIDPEGLVREYHVHAEMEGTVKGRPLPMKVERTIELSDLGNTVLELPEGVEKILQKN